MIGKVLVFWIGGRLWEVVTHEVRLYTEVNTSDETAHCANGSLIKILFSTVLYLLELKVQKGGRKVHFCL